MKNLKKSHKVLIGASLATLTLVPLVAVAATSCSNVATKNNSSTGSGSSSGQQLPVTVPTTQSKISTLVNEITSSTNLTQLDGYITQNAILSELNLLQDQVTFTVTPNYENSTVTFTIKLKNNFQFNPTLIKQSINGVTITTNTLTFNVHTSSNLNIGKNTYNLNIPKLQTEIASIESINSETNYNSLSANNLYTLLGINSSNASISVSNGAPIAATALDQSNHYYASKSISITTKNGQTFPQTIVSQIETDSHNQVKVSLSNANQTLNIQNIPTKYLLTSNIQVQLTTSNLKNLSSYLQTWTTLHESNEVLTNPAASIANKLGIDEGYLKVSLQNNSSETTADKDQAYDLTISVNPGCAWSNTSFSNQLGTIFNNGMSASFSDNTLTIKNIQTGIYTSSSTVATVDSALFNADDFASLQNAVTSLQKSNTLVTTINKVLNSHSQLPSTCTFVNVTEASNNSAQATICFANSATKTFENILVNFTPKQLDPTIFGNNANTTANVASTFMGTLAPTCVLNNTQLSNDKIATSNFGLNGTNALVAPSSVLSSTSVQQIMSKFESTNNINNQIAQDIGNSFATTLNTLFKQFSTSSSWSPTNLFITNSLVVNGSGSSLTLTGAINLEIFNNTNNAITIPANSSIFLNDNAISLSPGQYVAVSYNFDNSKITPVLVAQSSSTSALSYGLTNVNQTLVTYSSSSSKYESQTKELSTFNLPSQTSNLLNVTLTGVANNPNYYDTQIQKSFNAYLGALTKQTIQNQLTTQDNDIWKFVQTMGGDLGGVLTTLGTDPTVGQFLNSLSKPVTDVVTALTNDPGFGKLVGSLLSTETGIQFWVQNQPEIAKIVNQILTTPSIKNAINSAIKHLKDSIPAISGLGGGLANLATVTTSTGSSSSSSNGSSSSSSKAASSSSSSGSFSSSSSSSSTQTTPTSTNLMQDLKDLLLAYSKTQDFNKFLTWILGVAGDPTNSILSTQSIVEILTKDLQPILQNIISTTQSSQSTNPLWKFLNSILEMLTTIEKAQTSDTTHSIQDLKLFDILKKSIETNAIINFMSNGLSPFLKLVNPGAVAPVTKAIGIMTKVFSAVQSLNLTNPSLIFKALANLQVSTTNSDSSTQSITWQQLFDTYITCTPIVNVSSYDPETHAISYTNVMNYTFNQTVSINLSEIKQALSNITIQQVGQVFGVDIQKLIPGAASIAINTQTLVNTKVADLLPNTISIQKGNGISCIMSDTNATLNPTVVNGQITWWTNNPVILKFNFGSSADALFQTIFQNAETALDNSIKSWVSWMKSTINSALEANIPAVNNFINQYANGSFEFIGGWVNKINAGLTNYKISGYNNNVENNTYSVVQNTIPNNKDLLNILTNKSYYKNLSDIESTLSGKYIFNNDPALNEAIIQQLIKSSNLSWMTSKTPANMKPTVLVSFIPNTSLGLNINIMGIKLNKTLNVPGKFVVDIKFPTRVPVSSDNGKTYHMTDTISVTIPYNPTATASTSSPSGK